MGFGGSVAAMIASLKANKRTRVSTFDKIKDFKKSSKTELYFKKKASPLELKKIRDKLQKENDANFKRKILFLITLLIILLFLI
ncbi:hypothetical protein [Polaribacter sp. Z022]|uniref:hypothetical protein n=1 Tax=Polaribacter sp. Z022 TaxID=2927125 RepID=UPI0020224CCD|nr:hypothetical protein [Polaribacter sp. Z022]MCL7755055.1 hypothetical protein [Polaribacter sp. Z022]